MSFVFCLTNIFQTSIFYSGGLEWLGPKNIFFRIQFNDKKLYKCFQKIYGFWMGGFSAFYLWNAEFCNCNWVLYWRGGILDPNCWTPPQHRPTSRQPLVPTIWAPTTHWYQQCLNHRSLFSQWVPARPTCGSNSAIYRKHDCFRFLLIFHRGPRCSTIIA